MIKYRSYKALLISVPILVGIALFYLFSRQQTHQNISTPYQPPQNVAFNRQQYSLTDPGSIWVVVNKQRQLQPVSYEPNDLTTPHFLLTHEPTNSDMKLRKEMATAMGTMYDAAVKDNIYFLLSSGYRSGAEQKQTQDEIAQHEGGDQADRESAREGYSEHQTGLAADIGAKGAKCLVQQCFGNTDAGKWVANNGYKYGFIIRYPQDKEAITGYEYEPWHIRYVGTALATQMKNKNIETLEEFFELGPAPNYK